MAAAVIASRFLWSFNSNRSILQASKLIYGCNYRYLMSSGSLKNEHDVIIVGGGIVGIATARELKMRHPTLSVAVVEKENRLAAHQSGHNSGVIHAGIYYTPGSLRAKLCVQGLNLTYKYCDEFQVPYKKCGKLIVAVEPQEIPRLEQLMERGVKNGVKDLRLVGPNEIRNIEPNCRGLKAIHSPNTGIVDFGLVTRSYGKTFKELGGIIYTDFEVTGFSHTKESTPGSRGGIKFPITISGKSGKFFSSENFSFTCKYVVTCGGLHSDRLAQMSGCESSPRIIPFRGEYLELVPKRCDLVRGNIYPVPDPRFPFLGVHFTPRIDGRVLLGPNAVLAFKREGYGYLQWSVTDMIDALSYSGLRKLALRNLTYGAKEMYKGILYAAQVKQLRRFIPSLKLSDVKRGLTGVRAQALDSDGNLIEDFIFDSGSGPLGKNIIHVRNAPSPAATSSLAIAKMIANKCKAKFEL